MMPVVEVLKTIQELVCSYFSEEQFTLSKSIFLFDEYRSLTYNNISYAYRYGEKVMHGQNEYDNGMTVSCVGGFL